MKVWFVEGTGWGVNVNIVRAKTREQAIAVARESPDAEVTELVATGGEGILWSYEHSPDTGEDR